MPKCQGNKSHSNGTLIPMSHIIFVVREYKFIKDMNTGFIRFRSASRVSNRDRTFNTGSTPSNLGGSLTRVNSVTSMLKRLFSKEDRPDGGGTSSGNKTPGRIPHSSSSASLQARVFGKICRKRHCRSICNFFVYLFIYLIDRPLLLRSAGTGGSTRIGVIEEVDEQMTMTSMRPENRPHVQSIFPQGPPPASAPVDVPGSDHNRTRDVFSNSAPATTTAHLTIADGSNGHDFENGKYPSIARLIVFPSQVYRYSIFYLFPSNNETFCLFVLFAVDD